MVNEKWLMVFDQKKLSNISDVLPIGLATCSDSNIYMEIDIIYSNALQKTKILC